MTGLPPTYALRALNAGCTDGDRSLSSFGPMDCLGQYQTKIRPNEKSHPEQVTWWNKGLDEPSPREIEAQHSSAPIAHTPLRPLPSRLWWNGDWRRSKGVSETAKM